MGATLNVASAMAGHTLTDRASWVSFGNKGELAILVEGDTRLHNPYAAIVVNPERHPHVRASEAQAFVDWLTSARGQAAIAAYRVDGQQLFFPDVITSDAGAAGD
jgi:tungstate transport system substrate-binding protein